MYAIYSSSEKGERTSCEYEIIRPHSPCVPPRSPPPPPIFPRLDNAAAAAAAPPSVLCGAHAIGKAKMACSCARTAQEPLLLVQIGNCRRQSRWAIGTDAMVAVEVAGVVAIDVHADDK